MNETWIQWKPIENLAPKYDIDSIVDTINTFTIVLSEMDNPQKRLEVHFDSGVAAYRLTKEIYWQNSLHKLDEKYGEDFYGHWTFFKVENSSYLSWLSKESFEISDSRVFVHFAFLGADSILEVIAHDEVRINVPN